MIEKRKGDLGATSLLYGEEVGKDHLLLDVSGDIDELIVQHYLISKKYHLYGLSNVLRKNLRLIQQEIMCSCRQKFREHNEFLAELDLIDLDKKIKEIKDSLSKNLNQNSIFSEDISEISLLEVLSRKIERKIVALIKYEQKNFNILSPIVPREKTLDLNYLRGNTKLRTIFAAYFNRLNEYFNLLGKYINQLQFEISEEPFESDLPSSPLKEKRPPNV